MSDASSSDVFDCAVVQELLGAFLEGDLDGVARGRVEKHIDSCWACQEKLNQLREAREKGPEVPAEFASAVTAGSARGMTSGPGRFDQGDTWSVRPLHLFAAGGALLALSVAGGLGTARLLDSDSVSLAPLAPKPEPQTVVELTGVGDDQILSQGFTLERAVPLRIYALGEGSGGQMYDYAWIVKADTREPVWEMTYEDTRHAGGANKNRMSDEIISLEEGSYIVYYRTDGSHSYQEWNSGAPMTPERWGVTVSTIERKHRRAVRDYEPSRDSRIVVQVVGVGDSEHRQQPFKVREETDLLVYALGEGTDNEMYDYAWIEDAQLRRPVWQMRYEETVPAGGADKNRMYRGDLRLSPGNYILHYVTDDSHSFQDWNASPPTDAASYGVTLFEPK